MYEYKYVRLKATGLMVTELKGSRAAIDQHAAEGWRYAGWIPVTVGAWDGAMAQVDLIFEREV